MLLKGVVSVKVEKNVPAKAKKLDITKTEGFKEALADVKFGRIKEAANADDLFNQILGEDWRNV